MGPLASRRVRGFGGWRGGSYADAPPGLLCGSEPIAVGASSSVLARRSAPIAPATTKALTFGDRYFANNTPNSKAKKKQKRQLVKHTKTLKRFNKMGREYHPPVCNT